MQKLPDDLVEKFLSGNCTKEELSIVWGYLRNNPDEPYLLHEFEQTDGDTPLPQGFREDMLTYITEKTSVSQDPGDVIERPRRRRLVPLWVGAAAAALILLFRLWVMDRPAGQVSDRQLAVSSIPGSAWVEEANAGKRDMLLTLPDSSKVRLSPGARMRYRKGFGSIADRDVHIVGKAFFDIAKNEVKPFTLYSEGLRTEVLGTSFDVNANPYSDKIKVKLYTGKVFVSVADTLEVRGAKGYYLRPGEELVFSKSTHNVAIKSPVKHGTDEYVARSHPGRIDTISNWYMFNNQTLAEVFAQLSAIYNVDIQFSHEEIRDMYFIGKLERKDSLSEILYDIALLNHLSVTSQDGRYIIKKGKP
jgi:transmembrane sensor